ncbi:L-2,4-diaminobutyrate decarboxylase [Halogranum rubrum]|uniref:L-2,4-diaminobutyrate decarboxylase n=1 Tax=Halogranum rubrum TaxID=553466 RepID=A0A1I4CXR5_9EURY|nr:aspartate aminotransferase family protein [Halogranum rubrum]SFK86108.1 L-2,4-diaminobutyrate decarboxylase [Halogranum rubrum]
MDTSPPGVGTFLGTGAGSATYREAMDAAVDAVLDASASGPYSGETYDELEDEFDVDTLPDTGSDLTHVVEWVGEHVLANSVVTSDPTCVAHLQCPTAIPGLAAEAMLTALNQSMDSWDQSPAATVVEESMVEELCSLFGLPNAADGVFTSGGTASNLLGLLLARDRYVTETFGQRVQDEGLPPEASDLRILCSDAGHFTAQQSAAVLGLGEDAVVSVPTDDDYRMDPEALDAELARLDDEGKRPFALVATAGTTDFGSVDPLSALADRAAEHDLWFHVDAAYGGALAVSDRHREMLAGVSRADSVSLDFHKLLYQPISCGAFLLRDGSHYDLIDRNASYLNPEADEEAGVSNLVGKSLATTRRFDALKPFVTFQTLGREGVAELVDYTLQLADDVAELVERDPALELAADPTLNAVVFRYRPSQQHSDRETSEWVDTVNRRIRDHLLERGMGVVARTEVDGDAYLKFTLLNPQTTVDDVADLLVSVKQYGAAIESEVNE